MWVCVCVGGGGACVYGLKEADHSNSICDEKPSPLLMLLRLPAVVLYIYIYMYTWIYIYTYIYLHIHIYTYICIHKCSSGFQLSCYIFIYICIHEYIYIHIYIYIYIYIHIYVYTNAPQASSCRENNRERVWAECGENRKSQSTNRVRMNRCNYVLHTISGARIHATTVLHA